MPYDATEEGEITTTEVDASGEVLCTVDACGEETLAAVRLRCQLGMRARPLDADADGGADCTFERNGDEAEVTHAVDRAVTGKLGALPKGASQVHSLGPAPQTVTLTDDSILIGNNAAPRAARVGDEVQVTLYMVTAPLGLAGATVVIGILPTLPAPPPPPPAVVTPVTVKGTVTKGSSLVKVAGNSVS